VADQAAQGLRHVAAVAAAVVEELDQGHVALRVAADGVVLRGEDRLAVLGHELAARLDLRHLLAPLELLERLVDHLRLAQQVLAHHALDLGLGKLRLRTLLRRGGRDDRGRGQAGEQGEGGGAHGRCPPGGGSEVVTGADGSPAGSG
jgi:hypothetical protein